jgi:hypothetical protein
MVSYKPKSEFIARNKMLTQVWTINDPKSFVHCVLFNKKEFNWSNQ